MDLETLSGLYENSKILVRLLDNPHFAQGVQAILMDPEKCLQLRTAVDRLQDHVKVASLQEVRMYPR